MKMVATALIVLLSPAPSPAVFPSTCDGREVTLFGTDAPDILLGTSGDDVIHSGDGDDRILAGSGNDVLCGGEGADRIEGEDGDDLILPGVELEDEYPSGYD